MGTQYASCIFYHSQQQEDTAEAVKALVQKAIQEKRVKFAEKQVATQIWKAKEYHAAEKMHQRYLESQPWGYCNHQIRFDWRKI